MNELIILFFPTMTHLANGTFFFYYPSGHELGKLTVHWAPTFPRESQECHLCSLTQNTLVGYRNCQQRLLSSFHLEETEDNFDACVEGVGVGGWLFWIWL